ncbi:MAG: D-3-phosphoglycerate dehydrogenase [Syntrophomonadaceae bacterium]|nr:D-3-phosphoglycerate dehydrogenase [Bacillota bacterium]MBT9138113.1 D-3-phosphoglycerate dehydrogenase [Bacillota bacterium]
MKVLISDPISKEGMKILEKESGLEVLLATELSPAELKERIKDASALIIRSKTKVTRDLIEAGKALKIIGRAGAGVDNVDIEAATDHGIIVMNSPGANTISTAEHTIGMLLALSRNIPQGHLSLKEKGKWERSKFLGVELRSKTLGIIGLGRIGSEVAKRAMAMEMRCIVCDPFISPERAKKYGVELLNIGEFLPQADFITVHTPLTDETWHLLSKKEFRAMKNGVRIINCARGGIVDEEALYEAMKAGKVAGAALDVYEHEPPRSSQLLTMEGLVATPHIGASTEEAQQMVGIEIAQQVADALKGRIVRNAVNIPSIEPDVYEKIKPYLALAEKLGLLQSQLLEGRTLVVKIKYSGEISGYDCEPITIAILKGLLEPALGDGVNYVNALKIAKEREIKVTEEKSESLLEFANLISLEVETEKVKGSLSGTLFSYAGPRIVRVDGYHVDIVPRGHILIVLHDSKPGVIGKLGTILGDGGMNIVAMTLGRKEKKGKELTVFNLELAVPQKMLKKIMAIKEILSLGTAKL